MADYIDKIRVNGTDYDIKDPNLTEEVSSLKSAIDQLFDEETVLDAHRHWFADNIYAYWSSGSVKSESASGQKYAIIDLADIDDKIIINFDSSATFSGQAIIGMTEVATGPELPVSGVTYYNKSEIIAGTAASFATRGYDVSTVSQGYYSIEKAKLIAAVPTIKALAINFGTGTYGVKNVKWATKKTIPWLELENEQIVLTPNKVKQENVDGAYIPYSTENVVQESVANAWYPSSGLVKSAGAQSGTRGIIVAIENLGAKMLVDFSGTAYGIPIIAGDGGAANCNQITNWNTNNIKSYPFFDATHWDDDGYFVADIQAIITAYPTITHLFLNVPTASTGVFTATDNEKTPLEWAKIGVDNLDDELRDTISGDGVVKSYFSDELAETVDEIVNKSAEPCLALAFITDTHERESNMESVRITNEMFENVAAVNKRVSLDGIIHGGDILYPDNSDENPDLITVNKHFLRFVKKYLSANPYVYIVTGNHDGIGGTNPNQNNTYASLQKFNERYVNRVGNNPYYYFDYDKIKTRVIILSTSNYNTQYTVTYGLTESEYIWLRDTALNVQDGYRIIIFAHIQPYSTSVNWWFLSEFENLCNAFNSHIEYTDAYNVTKDFSLVPNSKIVAYIAGHGHYDMVINDNTTFTDYNLPFPIIMTGCSQIATPTPPSGGTTPSRTAKTATQDLWDTMIYRPDQNKIYMIRFGAGEDRTVDVP